MSRARPQLADMPGQDSFLDIVANMVGILIILVTVVGVRAGQATVDPDAADPNQLKDKLAPVRAQARSLASDVRRLHEQSAELKAELVVRDRERERLATYISAMKQEIEKRRAALDAASQADFDQRRDFANARAELQQLQRELAAAEAVQPRSIKVQNLPTPISKTVQGNEAHFQLRDGRVTFIPLDRLLEEFKSTARHKVWKLEGQSEMTDTIGPIGGFRLKYRLGRFEIPPEVARETGQVGSIIRLIQWELLPVSSTLGETLDIALSPQSQFRQSVAKLRKSSTITIWTYPDSFAEFRQLKAELHSLGFATAARPLPEGQPIGGSPDGSRSAAQ